MSDPYWRDVVLLLRAEGGAIVDKKGHAHTVTGNTSVSSAQYAPLTGATESIYFDGAGDRLTFNASSDWSLGDTFTIEFWGYFSALPVGEELRLLMTGVNGANDSMHVGIGAAGNTYLGLALGGSTAVATGNGVVTTGGFAHYAYVADKTVGYIFKGGILQTSFSLVTAQTYSSGSSFSVGYDPTWTGGDFNFNGYIDEIRITRGVARYIENFTAPASRFDTTGVALSGSTRDAAGALASKLVRATRLDTGALVAEVISATNGAFSMPVSGAIPHTVIEHDITTGDPHWDKVACLLSMDTAELHDAKGANVTKSGNVTRSPTQSKFGGYSAYFDGSGDRLQLACDLSGNKDITIEGFTFLRNGGHGQGYSRIFHLGMTNGQGALNLVCMGSGETSSLRASFWDATEVVIGDSAVLTNDFWYHFAIERVQNQWSFYLDGALIGTIYRGFDLTQTQLNIGANTSLTESFWGYLDEIRVTNGVARYGEPFTPPVVAFQRAGVSPGTANAAVLDNVIPV